MTIPFGFVGRVDFFFRCRYNFGLPLFSFQQLLSRWLLFSGVEATDRDSRMNLASIGPSHS